MRCLEPPQRASTRWHRPALYEGVDTHPQGRTWLAGDAHTDADTYLFVTLLWAQKVAVDLSGLSALQTFVKRMLADVDVQAAFKTESLA